MHDIFFEEASIHVPIAVNTKMQMRWKRGNGAVGETTIPCYYTCQRKAEKGCFR
ncbi:hypothetical protein I656_03011 [Geobacillus sp. WSUCF1]|nr:hypothetical protein I656_03011 [Geobacillus sp. WSUCF1]